MNVDPRGPAVRVSDRGFTLADGCFETMRAYGGVVFRFDAHLARLATTAERLGIVVPPHLDATIADVARALSAQQANAAVRLTLTRGVGPGLAAVGGEPPTTVVWADRLSAIRADVYTRGLQARIADGRRNEFAPTAGLKTLSYTDAVVALSAARAHGADDALLLDTEGHLSEASASNLFLVIRGVVHTPPRRCGALPGITRAAVLEILAGLDLPVEETPVPASAVLVANEMFLTNSLREIAPVTVVDGRPVGTGSVGPVTTRVRAAFAQVVAAEVADGLGVFT